MTDEKLQRMSEAQIRARYRDAPAYYMQAKLDKQRALLGRRPAAPKVEAPARIRSGERPARATSSEPARAERTHARRPPVNVDVALPGFEILDAALSALDEPAAARATRTSSEARPSTAPDAGRDAGRTQRAILEEALDDYSSWPIIGAEAPRARKPKPSAAAKSDLERRLALLLEAEPELELVLESEPELVPSTLEPVPDNVTVGAFGAGASGNVRAVSVAMDRKRPYMVRVIGKTTGYTS